METTMFEAAMIGGIVLIWAIGFKLIFEIHNRGSNGDD